VPRRQITNHWKWFGALVLGGQLIWLLVVSIHLHQRFSLTSDFAVFFQAWHAIAHGQFSPTTTVYRTAPFLTNHFELLIYPLALFEFIDPSGLILLVLQDLAIVGAELVAFLWILDLLPEGWIESPRARNAVAGGALIVLAVDPWVYWSGAFDFHLEAFATLFAVLAARSFWADKRLQGFAWSAATLCCGTVESTVLVGLGAAFLLTRRQLWREGVILIGSVVAWVVSLSAAGYDVGSQLASNYAYLTGSPPGAAVHASQVVVALLRHPRRVAHMLIVKRTHLWQIVGGAGTLGLVTGVGLPIAVAVLLPAALNAQLSVVEPEASFQVLPVLVFFPVAGVLALRWLSRQRVSAVRRAAVVLGVAAVVQTAVLALIFVPRSEPYFARTDAGAAQTLASVLSRTPADAEVIASNGMIGRFAGRTWIYAYELPTAAEGTVPVRSRTVEFVLSVSQGLETSLPSATASAIHQIEQRLGAHPIATGDGIFAFVWHPGPGISRVALPGL